MEFNLLIWLFALAITVHNIEEEIWLPAWSKTAGWFHYPVGIVEFRFAFSGGYSLSLFRGIFVNGRRQRQRGRLFGWRVCFCNAIECGFPTLTCNSF